MTSEDTSSRTRPRNEKEFIPPPPAVPLPLVDIPWPPPGDPKVHFGRLHVCVGRITNAFREPPGYPQYTQHIDLGDGGEGGLASSEFLRYYRPDDLIGRLVVALTNVIPLDHRGILCRTQLLCASDITDTQLWADHVQLLVPPPGSKPGDVVTVAGYPVIPDWPFVNPRTVVFETIAKEMRIDTEKQAVYRGVPLEVEGKGVVTAETLSNCSLTFE